MWRRDTSALLHYSTTPTISLVLDRLEHLVLSVYCFPSYCVLTPLMSPQDKTCNCLID